MIAKSIDRKKNTSNYRFLALYVANARIKSGRGEKILFSWYTSGDGENYQEGLIEVEATQAINTTATGDKTYHLMASFRPEDETKLTSEVLKQIEEILANALGFSDHQRHCGVHINTNNWHLHVVYNMIHPFFPKTFNIKYPYRDFYRLSAACRSIESQFGLVLDRGADKNTKSKKPGAKVKIFESQTGQESLFSYIMRHKEQILTGLTKATNWQELHKTFLTYGLILKVSGNGLAIFDRYDFGFRFLEKHSV